MRWIILGIVGALMLLTVVAYSVILPEERQKDALLLAYFDAAKAIDEGAQAPDELVDLLDNWTDLSIPEMARVADLPPDERREHLDRFQTYLESEEVDLESVPTLIWSTDDNAARRSQLRLFRAWHLINYGEPCDILPDPSNRDITKTVVQCVAGAGPDLIEGYGPDQLRPFVRAGIAYDITDAAIEGGYDISTVFPGVTTSLAFEGRQYAYPCNVGYTLLFYHKDLFEQAGIPEPRGPWSTADAVEVGKTLIQHAEQQGVQRQGLMNLGVWDFALGAGGQFFNEDGTACIYNSPATVAGLQEMQDLTYSPDDKIMPSPQEAASMSTSGGARNNASQESASASSLFAAKVAAMYVGGRWEYAQLAARNRDRVIILAMDRAIEAGHPQSDLLRSARERMKEDVLLPLSDEEYNAMRSVLNDDDRAALINLGVTHVPTVTGTPRYTVNARFAIANRASPNRDYAVRFLRFLASEAYNETINQTFDSICGVPAFCLDEDGISGPPRALPGLEAMDSPVFIEAVQQYGHPDELSPYVGRGRYGSLAGQILELVTNNDIKLTEEEEDRGVTQAEKAADTIERVIDRQMRFNMIREKPLRERWEQETGVEFDPTMFDDIEKDRPYRLRNQIEQAKGAA